MVLRVGLAGAGMISRHHLIAWSRRTGARVVALCDPVIERAWERAYAFAIPAAYSSLEAMLDAGGIDALDIATPRATHVETVLAAVARGIPSLCQKPLAPSLAEAEALAAAVSGRARVMVHENWRFRPQYRQIAAWLAEGRIGNPVMARLDTMSSGLIPGPDGIAPALLRQPFFRAEPRLMIAEVLIHHLDVLRWLLGPLTVLAARTAHPCPDVPGESAATILLETEAGAPVVVTGNLACPGYPPAATDALELVGTLGSIVMTGDRLSLLGPRPEAIGYDLAAAYQTSFDDTIAHFADRLDDAAPFETEIADNLLTLRLVEDAYARAGIDRQDTRDFP